MFQTMVVLCLHELDATWKSTRLLIRPIRWFNSTLLKPGGFLPGRHTTIAGKRPCGMRIRKSRDEGRF
jgi:hypothetical protein